MTAKHIQIFVDLEKKERLFEQQVFVRTYDDHWPWSDMDEVLKNNTDKHYVRSTTKTKINSSHEYFKSFAEEIQLKEEIYNQIRNLYDYIVIYEFDFFELSDNRKDVIFDKNETNFHTIRKEVIKPTVDNVFYIVKVAPSLHNHAVMTIFNFDKNYVFLMKSKLEKKDFPYQLYSNSRLLIERFWPTDLPNTKSMVEDFWLEIESPMEIKIVSKANLYFSKVIIDNQIFYPNSKQFFIEP